MVREVYESVVIDRCAKCSGVWLDHGELGQIVKSRQVKFEDAVLAAVVHLRQRSGVTADELTRHILCPRSCGVETLPVNYAGDSGIIVNQCPKCRGFWLDHLELESIQHFVEGIGKSVKGR